MTTPAICVESLSYTYPHAEQVVVDLSFCVDPGEKIGIVGANGAGKTTLLMLLCGLIPPSGGRIEISGLGFDKKSLPVLRRIIGMVFQNPDDQLFTGRVYDDVAFAPRNARLEEAQVARLVAEALDQVGLDGLADRPPYRLSDGEKRKAALAAVLSMHPEILLLDEPSATLDPRARKALIRLLCGLPQTCVITSHDLDLVLDTCGRTLLMADGRVIAFGNTDRILTDRRLLEENGLELPLSVAAGLGA